jgi:diguanylate cyclase (GGDEF)-like protein
MTAPMSTPAAAAAPSPPKTFAPESLRVLLFEDSAMDAALIKKFLQTTGVRLTNIFHTDTIPSALQVLTRENVDLCLTDYYLRPHTGFDLMDEARRFDVDIPFIMLTGMDDRSIDDGALSRGAYGFLIKGDLTVEGLERSMRYALTRHSRESALNKAAVYDSLTGLLNRGAFMERFAQAIDDNRQRSGTIGLLHINLNGTKFLNEAFGHKIGDDILKAVAKRLSAARRPSDILGRLGGDEFIFVLSEMVLPKQSIAIARSMMDAISGDIEARDGAHPITCAAGLVAETILRRNSPPTAELVDRMVQLAGRAMFEAKQRTRMSTVSELIMGKLGHDRVH